MLAPRQINLLAVMAIAQAVFLGAGCFKISVAPTCPADLAVGDTGTVAANPTTPGAIATYRWEVSPTTAGSFDDTTTPTTMFTALAAGTATITVFASDGLFQDVRACRTTIGGTTPAALSVSLVVSPVSPTTTDTLTLTCTVASGAEADTLTIDQVNGPVVSLTVVSMGVSTVTLADAAVYTFRCVGALAGGATSDPATITVTVAAPGRGGGRGDDGRGGR